MFSRNPHEREFASSLGAGWAGAIDAVPPESLDAVIDTTPVWRPDMEALKRLKPGGRLVINAIRKEEADKDVLLEMDYASQLWLEKEIKSVANVTRADVSEFLQLVAEANAEHWPLAHKPVDVFDGVADGGRVAVEHFRPSQRVLPPTRRLALLRHAHRDRKRIAIGLHVGVGVEALLRERGSRLLLDRREPLVEERRDEALEVRLGAVGVLEAVLVGQLPRSEDLARAAHHSRVRGERRDAGRVLQESRQRQRVLLVGAAAAIAAQAGRSLAIQADVGDVAAIRTMVDAVVAAFGQLDILVNNAAYQQHQKSLLDITDEQLERTFRTNIFGYFYMARAALPHLREGGVILNCSSVTGSDGSPELLDYAATKGAINAFTKSLAQNLLARGIRVNCVAPGPVWTPLNPADLDAEQVAEFGASVPMKRPAQPEEIAPAFVFLAAASDSSYVTGEVLNLFGGKPTP